MTWILRVLTARYTTSRRRYLSRVGLIFFCLTTFTEAKLTAMHEFGHNFGSGHDEPSSSTCTPAGMTLAEYKKLDLYSYPPLSKECHEMANSWWDYL